MELIAGSRIKFPLPTYLSRFPNAIEVPFVFFHRAVINDLFDGVGRNRVANPCVCLCLVPHVDDPFYVLLGDRLQHVLPFMSVLLPFLPACPSLPSFSSFLPLPFLLFLPCRQSPCLLSWRICITGAAQSAHSHPAGQPHVGHPRPASPALALVILTISHEQRSCA